MVHITSNDDTLNLLDDGPIQEAFEKVFAKATLKPVDVAENLAIGFAVVHIRSAGWSERCAFCGTDSVQPSRFVRWLLRSGQAAVRNGDEPTEALVFITSEPYAEANRCRAQILVDGLIDEEQRTIGRHFYSISKIVD